MIYEEAAEPLSSRNMRILLHCYQSWIDERTCINILSDQRDLDYRRHAKSHDVGDCEEGLHCFRRIDEGKESDQRETQWRA